MLRRYQSKSTLAVLLLLALTVALPSKARAAETAVEPAVDGILAAFEKHSLVGVGDLHLLANELEFYAALVRDPRFAPAVGNVVVEFGASQNQDILDRYLRGESVPYGELSKVWRDTVAWDLTLEGVGYQTFFAQVREVNRSLPPGRGIRVWLSEPPIDWQTIRTREAWKKIYDQRDRHAANLILREIIEPKRKALVIYGTGHFHASPWPSTWPVPSAGTKTLGQIVDEAYPGAFYLVTPYGGYKSAECSAALEAEMKWRSGVLIAPIRNTPIEKTLMRPGCMQPLQGIDPPIPREELERLERRFYEIDSGAAGDALLYLGPASELMYTPSDPTIWMDVDYYQELRRRYEIRHGEALWPLTRTLPYYAAPPRRWTRTR